MGHASRLVCDGADCDCGTVDHPSDRQVPGQGFVMIGLFVIVLFFFTTCYTVGVYIISQVTRNRFDIQRDYTFTPSVTVMMSCYNEGAAVWETIQSIHNSQYPPEKLEIIAFDDCSTDDDTWQWLQKAANDFSNVLVNRNQVNKGKPETLIDTALIAHNDIIICTDSDTLFDPLAIRELVACFKSPHIGAVGGVTGINNTNDSLVAQMQALLYSMNYYLYKPMENLSRNVQCLGGPLAAFRRELYLSLIPAIRSNDFLGLRVVRGEDRFITQQVLLSGLKTFVTLRARCWVNTPTTWQGYLKQQLRWRRSAIGQWFNTLKYLLKFLRNAGVICVVCSLFPIMAAFAWMTLLLFLFENNSILQFIATLLIVKCFILPVVGLIFNQTIGTKDSRQYLRHPSLASILLGIWLITSMTLVTPWALFTLDDGGWVTRQPKVITT